MTTGTIDHAGLLRLVASRTVWSVHIVAQPGGWTILVKDGATERAVVARHSDEARLFRKLDTLVGFLNSFGIVRFHVDALNWHAASTARARSSSIANSAGQVDYEVDYNNWLKSEVQEAIDDKSPTIPHDEVVRKVRAAIEEIRAKRVRA